MTESDGKAVLLELRARLPKIVEDVQDLVEHESPSPDLEATWRCADLIADMGKRLLKAAASYKVVDDHIHLHWRFGASTKVLLLAHFDTVWPRGTIERWPFRVDDGSATGPGVFDMKAGVVQGLHALSMLDDLDGIELLVTSDEEDGSTTSRRLIEEAGLRAGAALVLEPALGSSLKTGRKGVAHYEIEVRGRAAHAGLEPHKGVNATGELARQVLAIEELARPELGTTVTPTVSSSGTVRNVVPASARVEVDVRAIDPLEQERVDNAIRNLQPQLPGSQLIVHGGVNRPPLHPEAADVLFGVALGVVERLGLPAMSAAQVGGASDGNFTAAVGTPTLDGLGPVGDGAHAEGELVQIDSIPERAALVTELVKELQSRPVLPRVS